MAWQNEPLPRNAHFAAASRRMVAHLPGFNARHEPSVHRTHGGAFVTVEMWVPDDLAMAEVRPDERVSRKVPK